MSDGTIKNNGSLEARVRTLEVGGATVRAELNSVKEKVADAKEIALLPPKCIQAVELTNTKDLAREGKQLAKEGKGIALAAKKEATEAKQESALGATERRGMKTSISTNAIEIASWNKWMVRAAAGLILFLLTSGVSFAFFLAGLNSTVAQTESSIKEIEADQKALRLEGKDDAIVLRTIVKGAISEALKEARDLQ